MSCVSHRWRLIGFSDSTDSLNADYDTPRAHRIHEITTQTRVSESVSTHSGLAC